MIKKSLATILFVSIIMLATSSMYSFSRLPSHSANSVKSEVFVYMPSFDVSLIPLTDESEILLGTDRLVESTVLPDFISYDPESNILTANPTKHDVGKYVLKSTEKNYIVIAKAQMVNMDELRSDLEQRLGSNLSKYAIYLHDITRDQKMIINSGVTMPPASIAKMTVALMVMQDIERGKYTLQDTHPITASNRFTYFDPIEDIPDGTQVTVDKWLQRLLIYSDNNAWYVLYDLLGGTGVVNPRTDVDLGTYLYLDPHVTNVDAVGKLFFDLYNANTVSEDSQAYIYEALTNAVPFNREVIGLGLPEGTRFVNKIGNLKTDTQINFQDAAIVWGEQSDYVLVILNNDVEWEDGRQMVSALSKIVYDHLNP